MGITVENFTAAAFEKARKGFEGEAERLGLKDIDDVVALVDEVRTQMWEEFYESS
ncbi:MAG: hypothetical protein FWG90_08680 [Oscillospiraceae bacterium]|nr:hypothetical protein [Oscillospiraceae bacterium]